MVHLFISYGGRDRKFARALESAIENEFDGKISTRIIEDINDFSGKTWKGKVLDDLAKTRIFIIIFTKKSKTRQWPNQELGYAYAHLKMGTVKHLIPVVEVEAKENSKHEHIELRGFITEDMDKIPYLIEEPNECIEKIIKEL